MTIATRLADVEESLRLLRDANRLQGRPLSATAPTDNYYLGWNNTTKKWEPKGLTFVRKTADEVVNDSNTLQDDDALKFSIAASETWVAEFFVHFTTSLAGDIKFAVTVPSGATIRGAVSQQTGTANQNPSYLGIDTSGQARIVLADAEGATALRMVHIPATVVNSTTAGDVQLQWAQNTADAVDTKVYTNSWLRAYQL